MDETPIVTREDISEVGLLLEDMQEEFERVMRYLNLTDPGDVLRLLLATADRAIARREHDVTR